MGRARAGDHGDEKIAEAGKGQTVVLEYCELLGPLMELQTGKKTYSCIEIEPRDTMTDSMALSPHSAASFDARFPNQVSEGAIQSVASGPPHLTIRLFHPFSHFLEPNKALLAKVSSLFKSELNL